MFSFLYVLEVVLGVINSIAMQRRRHRQKNKMSALDYPIRGLDTVISFYVTFRQNLL